MKNKQNIKDIHHYCRLHHLTIATCESFTVGKLASNLASLPGSSHIFKGGIIAYHEETKQNLLKITGIEIISQECAQQMALAASKLLAATVIVATTGNAGPTSLEAKPVGQAYISIYFVKLNKYVDLAIQLHGYNRNSFTKDGCKQTLQFLAKTLKLFPNLD